jgi:hypothetical protein
MRKIITAKLPIFAEIPISTAIYEVENQLFFVGVVLCLWHLAGSVRMAADERGNP